MYEEVPEPLSETEKKNWISSLQAVAVSSDAFFPFRDNIDRAKRVNITHLSQKHEFILYALIEKLHGNGLQTPAENLLHTETHHSENSSVLTSFPTIFTKVSSLCVSVCRVVLSTLQLQRALLLMKL